MFQRLLVFALTVTLITIPAGPIVAPAGSVAHADYGYCEYAVIAHAYFYADGSEVGASAGQGAFLDAETADQCASVAQNYALFDSGNACGSYEAGVAYAAVEWRVWWNDAEVPGSPVVQQYDCGDV
jgi:hypothetical protein